jgi:hypothetical protein
VHGRSVTIALARAYILLVIHVWFSSAFNFVYFQFPNYASHILYFGSSGQLGGCLKILVLNVLGDRPIEITVCSLLAEQWFILMVYWYL